LRTSSQPPSGKSHKIREPVMPVLLINSSLVTEVPESFAILFTFSMMLWRVSFFTVLGLAFFILHLERTRGLVQNVVCRI